MYFIEFPTLFAASFRLVYKGRDNKMQELLYRTREILMSTR